MQLICCGYSYEFSNACLFVSESVPPAPSLASTVSTAELKEALHQAGKLPEVDDAWQNQHAPRSSSDPFIPEARPVSWTASADNFFSSHQSSFDRELSLLENSLIRRRQGLSRVNETPSNYPRIDAVSISPHFKFIANLFNLM